MFTDTHAVPFCGDELDHRLVVDELDVGPLDPLRHVDGLLQLEGVVVEMLLKHLVGEAASGGDGA